MLSTLTFRTSASAADAPAGNADAAKAKISMCIGCHGIPGYKASFPEVYSVPMIAGQSDKYIQAALKAYASGARTHPTMDSVATSLSDQDIADLAAYYSNAKSPILPEYPVLAGQHADYLAHALKAYQRGAHEAPTTANGRKNAVMGAFAVQLSSQDISNVTAWLASMPGPLSVHK
eukprot:gene11371-11460_t